MDDIDRAINELAQKKEQLKALILFLKRAGPSNPQYHQIASCEAEYELVTSQISALRKISKIQQARKNS